MARLHLVSLGINIGLLVVYGSLVMENWREGKRPLAALCGIAFLCTVAIIVRMAIP